MRMYKELYNKFLTMLKKSPIVFSYLCLDELYTFYAKKENRIYVWSAVGVTKSGRKFYFYFLSKKKNIESLLSFNFDLPRVERWTFCIFKCIWRKSKSKEIKIYEFSEEFKFSDER